MRLPPVIFRAAPKNEFFNRIGRQRPLRWTVTTSAAKLDLRLLRSSTWSAGKRAGPVSCLVEPALRGGRQGGVHGVAEIVGGVAGPVGGEEAGGEPRVAQDAPAL